MPAGIATPPVEGRFGAAMFGKDQSFGSDAFQAGVFGGNPNTYNVTIALPNVKFKRQPSASFIRRP